MIITLLKVYLFILGFMILTLFQGHRFVRIINSQLFLRFSSTVENGYMIGTNMKNIEHSMPCVTIVYIRDLINTFSPLFMKVSLSPDIILRG